MSYVYMKTDSCDGYHTYTVGFYTPDGKWVAESDHSSSEEAAKRTAWLNGGKESE